MKIVTAQEPLWFVYHLAGDTIWIERAIIKSRGPKRTTIVVASGERHLDTDAIGKLLFNTESEAIAEVIRRLQNRKDLYLSQADRVESLLQKLRSGEIKGTV